jgi:hypothetical protein
MEGAIENIDVPVEAGEPTEDRKPEAKREPSERDRRLAELAKQHNESLGLRQEEADDEEEEEEESPPLAAKAEIPDPFKEFGAYRNPKGEYVTKMKVNGEEVEVPLSQIKSHLQKDIAGDRKLQEAAAERQRLQRERELLEQERTQKLQQSMAQNRPPKLDAEEAKKRARALLERVYDGDLDNAAEEFASYLQGSPVDTDNILAEAERRAMSALERKEAERNQREFQDSINQGVSVLKTTHPEVLDDPRLFDLVDGETLRILDRQKSGDPEFASLTPKEIIIRAAQSVDEWRKGAVGKPKQGTREERKANLKPMPRGMNATRQPNKPPEVDMSPAAVIARMAAARATH